jgi:DNA primase
VPILSKISDKFIREHYVQKLSALLLVDEKLVRSEVEKTGSMSASFKQIDQISSTNQLKSRRVLLEEYLISLLLHIPKGLTFVPNFSESIFTDEQIRSLYVMLVLYLDAISFKAKSFEINQFVESLPQQLADTVDRVYLMEIDQRLENADHWQTEVTKIVAELKKGLIKASLERLSQQIKNAQVFGNIDVLSTLNRRFRDLSVRLRSYET